MKRFVDTWKVRIMCENEIVIILMTCEIMIVIVMIIKIIFVMIIVTIIVMIIIIMKIMRMRCNNYKDKL